MSNREATEYVVKMRRYFHEHPEESFKEYNTAKKIEEEIKDMGLSPRRVADTGVVVDIKGKSAGKMVAFRADIDALPVTEKNDVVYKSKNSGFMHACGHDCHIAMALDIARYFSANRDFNGIVRVFFQPAEESPPGGAVKMIQEGVLEDVDYIIGQHVGSDIPSGKIGYRAGPSNANADSFRIKIKGRGGHGSAPHKSVDAIYIAAEFITLAQTIVSRKVDPVKAAVVTFGTIHGGYRHNIIGDEVEMTGTARTQDMETRALVKSELKNILEGLCKLTHSEFDFEYEEGYPVMVNDPEITEKIANVASGVVGKNNVVEMPQKMGGEDFGYYLQKVRGAFYYLGISNEKKGFTSSNHSPTFDVDEEALPIGTRVGVAVIKELLAS